MFAAITDSARRWTAFGLAAGVVLIDSTSRLLSMCADLVIVGLLLAVLLLRR